MNEVQLSALDESRLYSYADYCSWKFQERIELIKGRIFKMTPAPLRIHQMIVVKLTSKFDQFLSGKTCQVYVAPFDVRLPTKNEVSDELIFTVVQPDLVVVCDLEKLDERGCIGAPDLVIEILSSQGMKKDMFVKYKLYEESGVPEYWVVFPNESSITAYELDDQSKYVQKGVYDIQDSISPNALPEMVLSLNTVFI